MLWRGLYRGALALAAPAVRLALARRLRRGKEDPQRFAERRGVASRPRPPGPLVWIHAASNGEAMSAQPLIERLAARDPAATVLLTTGTVTSAQLMAKRLPANAIHQYVPVDFARHVAAFRDHWRPDLGIWIESELWPNLVWAMRDAGRPLALVNGRVSARSFRRWRRVPGLARDLLGAFAVCLAQTPAEAERLRALGARDVDCLGNLKFSAPTLAADPALLASLRAAVADRPLWLAASTHPGEEAVVADAHARLAPSRPDLLTIVVPRHPARGAGIAESLRGRGLRVARRAEEPLPPAEAQVYVADTLGELGLFYSLAEVVLIGGTLAGGIGGHNPVEAVQLDCALMLGPDMANFASVAAELYEAGGARSVTDAESLAATAATLLDDEAARRALMDAGAAVAARNRGVADRVLDRLAPLLPPVSAAEAPAAVDPASGTRAGGAAAR